MRLITSKGDSKYGVSFRILICSRDGFAGRTVSRHGQSFSARPESRGIGSGVVFQRRSCMPLPTKTLREASAELGIPEAEIRAMIDLNKIRAIFKKGTFYIAPDEMGKIKRQRKTLPDSAIKSPPAAPVVPPRPAPPRPASPPRTSPPPPPRRTET